MKKQVLLIFMVLLSMFALTMFPMSRSATNVPNQKFDVTLAQTQFVEAAVTPTSDPVGTYVPYDVDMVNGELYPNGGAGVYVAIIDTGLVSNWASFLPTTATVDTADARAGAMTLHGIQLRTTLTLCRTQPEVSSQTRQ